jgi:hypothetical protein
VWSFGKASPPETPEAERRNAPGTLVFGIIKENHYMTSKTSPHKTVTVIWIDFYCF